MQLEVGTAKWEIQRALLNKGLDRKTVARLVGLSYQQFCSGLTAHTKLPEKYIPKLSKLLELEEDVFRRLYTEIGGKKKWKQLKKR